jgi:glycosyltransferase involved in cell wall biosynthesis
MKVLQINTVDTKGGAAKIAYSLKKELEKKGHTTSMFVGRKYSDEENIKLLNDVRSFSGRVRRKMAFYLANDIDVFPSNHILKTPEFKEADIVHCHNLHSNYFNLNTLEKISTVKPVIWTFHDMWPITGHCAHSFDGALKSNGFFTCPSLDIYPPIAWHNEKYLENKKAKIYSNSRFYIVTPSKWLANKVKESALKDKPISIIYNGIDISIFKPQNKQECREALGLPQDEKIILIVAKGGQLNPWKGGGYAQETIKALKSNPSAFFVDLGGGNTDLDGPNLKMAGFIENPANLAKYYSSADTLLYPSIADNCPLVVLEAMACGLPVVSFNTGGIPELVEHRINGYIADYKDADDLKSGVEYLLNLPFQEIEKMSQYSIEKIKTGFTLEKMTDQYIELYKKAL